MAAAAVAERLRPLETVGRRPANWRLFPIVMAVGYAGGASLAYFSIWCAAHDVGLLVWLRGGPPRPPTAAQTAAGFLLFELGDYGRHYAFHRVPLLWRLHQVHHSDPALDVSTAFRSHPLENVAQAVWYFAVVAAFGVPLEALLLRTPLLFFALIFQHANVELPFDRWVCLVTPSPRQHRVHHSPDPARTDTNFGVILTVWDRLFGTYVYPRADETLVTGLAVEHASLRDMLAAPFRSAHRPRASRTHSAVTSDRR